MTRKPLLLALLVLLGAVCVVVGVYLLAGPGVALIVAGLGAVGVGLVADDGTDKREPPS